MVNARGCRYSTNWKGESAMRKLSLVLGTILAIGTAQQASAAASYYYATMSGANENPANASTATGLTLLTLNGDMLTVAISFSGLTGVATGAHIHCCTAQGNNVGIALPYINFPSVTGGNYLQNYDLSMAATYTSTFLNTFGGGTAAGAELALIAGLNNGTAYSNIHDAQFGGGEIRGFIRVPEPLTLSLFGAGLVGAAALRRRAKTSDKK